MADMQIAIKLLIFGFMTLGLSFVVPGLVALVIKKVNNSSGASIEGFRNFSVGLFIGCKDSVSLTLSVPHDLKKLYLDLCFCACQRIKWMINIINKQAIVVCLPYHFIRPRPGLHTLIPNPHFHIIRVSILKSVW